MRKKSLAALLLAGAILLTGCGSNTKKIATVGDQKITQAELQFYMQAARQRVEEFNVEEIRQSALEQAKSNLVYTQVAKAMGIELTEEEKQQIVSYKKNVVASYGNEEKYKASLKTSKITDAFIDTLVDARFYQSKLISKMEETNPTTDEEMKAYFDGHYRRAKHVLLLTQDMTTGAPLDADAIAKAKETADDVLKKAQAGENFDALVSEYSEDPGSASNPNGYVFTDGDMVQEFQDGVDALKPGEIGMVKSGYGYHVIQRLALDETQQMYEEDFEKAKSDISSKVKAQKLDEQIWKWAEEYGIEISVNQAAYEAVPYPESE